MTPRMLLAKQLALLLIVLPSAEALSQSLRSDAVLTRIAFGSCAKQDQPQPIWDAIVAEQPDVFLFLGDNIYGDSDQIDVLRAKYDLLAAQPGYRRLRQVCPILATWDDHDYGANDAGIEFGIKRQSQQLFLDFFGASDDDPRRSREGIYSEVTVGPPGKRVQFILLDTRYFRSPLVSRKNTRPRSEGIRGDYVPTDDPSTTILGADQWEWFEQQLRKPADLRIIGSSIQVIAEQHGWEKWANFPHERRRFFQLLRHTAAQRVILLSGDRHLAEIARLEKDDPLGTGHPILEITSSSLNSPSGNFTKSGTRFVNELNDYRVGLTYFETNFGMIQIDWTGNAPSLLLQVRDQNGGVVLQYPLDFAG